MFQRRRAAVGWNRHTVLVTMRDKKDLISVLLYSYSTTIYRVGGSSCGSCADVGNLQAS